MIAWSEAVRDVLAKRFGPEWCAKTTEEIATAEELIPAFGAEEAGRLLRFLNEADLAKFAGDHDDHSAPPPYSADAWEAWVTAFTAPAAGASSTISGK
jgi:hypothetical protein